MAVRHTRRVSTIPEIRTLPVPDGLEGERVDAAISRMFGFSRTKAAELAAAGKVTVDGSVVGKSERVHGGAWLEVEMPQAPAPVQVVAEPVEGMEIVHDDEDVVVIVKPVGVAAHPSPGWSGPTVIGGLAAAGYRISTSGAAERQGIVHRLDVGTSGVMVGQRLATRHDLVSHLAKLPGFDHRNIANAMASPVNQRFLLWRAAPLEGEAVVIPTQRIGGDEPPPRVLH